MTLPARDEQDMATRLQRSDREAYAELFRRLSPSLVAYARQITRDESAAWDVIQDVFLKLWSDRASLNVRVSLRRLLYTMTRNRALNSIRRKRWTVKLPGFADEVRAADVEAADERLAADDVGRFVRKWIAELPARRREAFLLSRDHGLFHREIAEIMGLSERTVDTHILLALRQLRERLDALEEEG